MNNNELNKSIADLRDKKKTLYLNYQNTGIKLTSFIGKIITLFGYFVLIIEGFSLFFLVICILAKNSNKDDFLNLILFLSPFLSLLIIGGLLKNISTITKKALYQKTILEEQYDFKEKI